MAAEATMLQILERDQGAFAAQSLATSSPLQASDDDTIPDNTFDAGPDHFAFTPKRRAKQPRAWERKPATPFAPRTETQKIWKRVPLQDKSTNNAIEIRRNGKDNIDARGVKRVRLTAPHADSGKENYASTQWDKQSDNAKRKMPREQKNVLQTTRSSLSPLRKDCTLDILNDPSPATTLELEADHVIRRLDQMQQAEKISKDYSSSDGLSDTEAPAAKRLRDENNVQELQSETAVRHIPQTPTSGEDEAEPGHDSEDVASADSGPATSSTNGFFTDSVIFDDQESESEVNEYPISVDLTQNTQHCDARSETTNEHPQSISPRADACRMRTSLDHKHANLFEVEPEPSQTYFELLNTSNEQVGEDTSVTEIKPMASIQAASSPRPRSGEDEAIVLHSYGTVPDLLDIAEDQSEQTQLHVESQALLLEPLGPRENIRESDSTSEHEETLSESETSLRDKENTIERATDLQIPSEASSDDVAVTGTAQYNTNTIGEAGNNLFGQLFTPQGSTISALEAPPSDDTAYLHDFLSRARAQKAARAATSPEKTDPVTNSLAKNTRQALANLSPYPTSPSKSTQMDMKLEEVVVEDTMNDDQATSPCRRSSRPRLSKPPKSIVPAIPNTIPVRRSNGTEFVFLQRTEAMQVALDTRTNTKRNKGEAVPPVARLETLASAEMSPVKERKKSSKAKKAVKWDEKLTQEQLDTVLEDQAVVLEAKAETKPEAPAKAEEKAAAEAEKSEKREKKKVKRLGTVNGTPAPKKVMAATALPVPSRTLRARTKS